MLDPRYRTLDIECRKTRRGCPIIGCFLQPSVFSLFPSCFEYPTILKASLAIMILSFLILTGVATADALQVTQNTYEDGFPSLKGNYLVWQGKSAGDWEIFLYNIGTQETVQITNNDYNDISPRTDGNCVVWVGYNNQGGEIFLYDITAQSTTQITNNSFVDNPPQIAAGRVVWTSFEVTDSVEPGDVYLYDIPLAAASCLSCGVDPENTLDDTSPKISADQVMWVQTGGAGVIRLLYDIATNHTTQAPDGFVWQESPQTAGDVSVSTRHDGEDREIFVTSATLKATDQITDNSVEDRSPCISTTTVAWAQGEGPGSDIFVQSNVGAPTAQFTGNPLTGMKPLDVSFQDGSSGFVGAWSWDFGDGTHSNDQNPSHTYTNAGDFAVTLTVTGPNGNDVKTKQNYVHVSEPLCECTLTPDDTTVSRGSTLGFEAALKNNMGKTGVVRFGTKAKKPNGQLTDYVWGPVNVHLTGQQSVSAHKTHDISQTMPLGLYEYYGYVWRDDVGMMDVCSFEFEVIE